MLYKYSYYYYYLKTKDYSFTIIDNKEKHRIRYFFEKWPKKLIIYRNNMVTKFLLINQRSKSQRHMAIENDCEMQPYFWCVLKHRYMWQKIKMVHHLRSILAEQLQGRFIFETQLTCKTAALCMSAQLQHNTQQN